MVATRNSIEDYSRISEKQLRKLYREGNDLAFDEINKRYKKRSTSMANSMLRNLEDAEDAWQETLIKLLRYREKYDSSKPLDSWIIAILRNTCKDLGRKRKSSRFISLDSYFTEDNSSCVGKILGSSDKTPYEILEKREKIDRVKRITKSLKLSEKQREILELINVRGLSYSNVAEIMEIPIGTVKSAVNAIKSILIGEQEKLTYS